MAFCLHCGQPLQAAVRCPSCGAPAEEVEERSSDDQLTAQIKRLLQDGRKIEAIKAYRESTGASLAEAKQAVENWMSAEGLITPQGKGCATSILLLVLAGAGGLAVSLLELS